MQLKNQLRGPYCKISDIDKQLALDMKEQGFKNKEIAKLTGIKVKTLYSLQKIKKSKFSSITNRIKVVYLEQSHNQENIPPLKTIKKEIKKIIDSQEDQQLTKLIQQSSKKFDSSNRRVIHRIAEEISRNQYEPQYSEVYDWDSPIHYPQQFLDSEIQMEVNSYICSTTFNCWCSEVQDYFPTTEQSDNI